MIHKHTIKPLLRGREESARRVRGRDVCDVFDVQVRTLAYVQFDVRVRTLAYVHTQCRRHRGLVSAAGTEV